MKNLANCVPSEFLRQSNRIRKAVAKWLDLTQIMEIRKHSPEIIELTVDMKPEEREEAIKKNRVAFEKQAKENFGEILDKVLEEYPNETLELLGLLCFIEPKDVDSHPMAEYIDALNEMMSSEAVLGFFTSLMQLVKTITSLASKQ